MRSLRKRMFVIISTVLMVSLIAGCAGGNNAGNNSANQGSTTVAPTATPAVEATEVPAEPIEISWLSFNFPADDDTLGQKYIEEKYNVKLKNIRIDRANWKDQLNVFLASGELPDVWLLWGIADVSAYSAQNLLAELPIDEIKANMPTLAQLVDDNEPQTWANGLVNGKSYGIPITNIDGIYPFFNVYNENWLKKIGYDSAPTTLAELEDVVYKFRNNDPDGNGTKDTYGITGRAAGNLNQAFGQVFGAFDVIPQYWVNDEAGSVVYGMTTENAREAFKVLNKWFEDGVIDPEFITADGKIDEFRTGKVGTGYEQWNSVRPSFLEAQSANGTNPFTITVAGTVAADGYNGSALAWGLTGNYMGMSVDVDLVPGKREKIYELLNATYSDPEVIKFINYGTEGKHHELVDGVPKLLADVTTDTLKNEGIGAYYGIMSSKSTASEPIRFPQRDLDWRNEAVAGVPLVFNQVKFNIPSANQFPDIMNMEKEYFIKFITGEVDLDAGFDDFVNRWNKAGGEVLTREANEIYAANKQ